MNKTALNGIVIWTMFLMTAYHAQTQNVRSQDRAGSKQKAISALAFSPNGSVLALGGYRTVILQDVRSGKTLATLPGEAGVVTFLAFSPNGEMLAAAGGSPGQSGEIKLWNVKSAKPLLSLTGTVDMMYGVAFRPDGRQIAGVSYDHSVTLWNLPEPLISNAQRLTPNASPLQPSQRLRDHTDAVYAVAYSPDGTRLASAGGDRTVKVWDVKTGKRLYTLSESTAELYAVAFRPGGNQIAAGGVDKALRVWNISENGGTLIRAAFAHDAAVLRIVYTKDGKSLLTSGEDNAVKRWNADTLDEEKVYPHQTDWPQGLAVNPTGDKVAVGCHDGSFALFDLAMETTRKARIAVTALARLAPLPQGERSWGEGHPESNAKNISPEISDARDSRAFLAGCAMFPLVDAEVKQAHDNSSPAKAQSVPAPVTISGTLWNGKANSPAPTHYYRFPARKGETLILDVMARRSGSPLDSEIAVCDLQGKPIERAVLRAVGQTEVTLFDRDSVSPGIRLVLHPDLRLNDYVLIGREVIRIGAMPKGPDDDYQFRSYRGQRLGYLGTTPEYHSIGAAVYKVEIHPPGTKFSSNGMPLTRLVYQNDDGGPLYGRDSYLEFTPPADGDYLVRITDARGQQGEKYAYRLNIHPPRPDFKIVSSPASPSVTKGGSDTISVECERYEGFTGEIALRLEGLPPGFTSTQSVIEAGENAATLLIHVTANTDTPVPPAPGSYRVVATAVIAGKEVTKTIEPDEKNRRLKVVPPANVAITTDQIEAMLQPGKETVIEARIERRNKFGGRVPVEVRNLPFGVKVQDVGLNGVLITEKETTRKFVIYCEPWVQPQTRQIYVMALPEGQAGTGALPITLKIQPAR